MIVFLITESKLSGQTNLTLERIAVHKDRSVAPMGPPIYHMVLWAHTNQQEASQSVKLFLKLFAGFM